MGTDAPRSKRHRRLRALVAVLAVVVSFAIVAAGLGVWTVTRSFPTLSGQMDLAGLGEEVTVYRDEAGIPQIVAQSAADLFLAEGYVHAQDRFWEMDFRRHVTSGRLSELFGASQLGTDTFIRTLGWRAVAEEEVKLLDPVTLGYYQAYADGVNAYLATHEGADLSLEYVTLGLQNPGYTPEPWTPADSVAWLKAMAWDLRSNLEDEIDRALLSSEFSPDEVAELHPEYPWDTHPTILGGPPPEQKTEPAPAEPAVQGAQPALASSLADLRTSLASVPELLGPAGGEIGSNSWVVSGALTDTGAPILANDPHLGPVMPSVWYQVGLRCETVNEDCPFDVAGYSFSGLPGVVIGHNDRIAWGFTNLGPDVADLYLEKVTEDTYEYDGEQKPLAVHNEIISVAGASPVTITIRSTEHGPLVSGLNGTAFRRIAGDYPEAAGLPSAEASEQDETDAGAGSDDAAVVVAATAYELSLQWTALTPGTTASAIFALNSATDWDGFRAAARLFEVPSQNLLYADVDDNIGYQAPGRIPVRTKGDGTLPVPGWTSDYGWDGYVPFDSLPKILNPASGYIVTANNAAVDADFRYLITEDWDQGYRANRITSRLQKLIDTKKPLSTEMMSKIQADNYSAIAAALVPVLQEVTTSGTTAEAQALFEGWNYNVDADSAAAAYFNIVWRTLLSYMFDDKLPEGTEFTGSDRAFSVVITLLEEPDSPWWTNERVGSAGRSSMLERVLRKAAEKGVELMGTDLDDWRWGSIHTLELTNASFGESGIAPIEWLFNRGPYDVGGGSSVVNAVGWDATKGYGVNWVPSMRQVISLADFDDSSWINLTGASGHAFHPNYADQTPLWQHNETRPWAFTLPAVTKTATDTLTLTPR